MGLVFDSRRIIMGGELSPHKVTTLEAGGTARDSLTTVMVINPTAFTTIHYVMAIRMITQHSCGTRDKCNLLKRVGNVDSNE